MNFLCSSFSLTNILFFVFSFLSSFFSFLVFSIYFSHWKNKELTAFTKKITLGISLSSFGLGIYHLGLLSYKFLCEPTTWFVTFILASFSVLFGYYYMLSPYIQNIGLYHTLKQRIPTISSLIFVLVLFIFSIYKVYGI